jgi:hypothetical protein
MGARKQAHIRLCGVLVKRDSHFRRKCSCRSIPPQHSTQELSPKVVIITAHTPQSLLDVGTVGLPIAYALRATTPLLCIHRPPIAASPTHRTAERQPCRGANSLRPHPDGPHALFGRRPSQLDARPRVFWPEAIAARWSCGPHVTPASNRRRRCRAGVGIIHTTGTSEMCRPQPDHFLLYLKTLC